MIGIIVAAHGPLPEALLESSRMIIGDLPQVAAVSLMPGDSLQGLVDRLNDSCEQVESGDGVLILLDLFGGTPANAATLLTQQRKKTFAVTGVNLPMLMEILLERNTHNEVEVLARTAETAGQAGIIDIVKSFAKFREGKKE